MTSSSSWSPCGRPSGLSLRSSSSSPLSGGVSSEALVAFIVHAEVASPSSSRRSFLPRSPSSGTAAVAGLLRLLLSSCFRLFRILWRSFHAFLSSSITLLGYRPGSHRQSSASTGPLYVPGGQPAPPHGTGRKGVEGIPHSPPRSAASSWLRAPVWVSL